MKFRMLLPALAALTAASAAAQSPAPPPSFSPDAFRAHVAFLADDLLEGREAGSRGYDIAARYVAAQFESLGLRPASASSWFQPVDFVRFANEGPARLTLGGRSYAHGEDLLLRANPDPEALAIEAPLVFAGHGFDVPERGFDDYRGLDVRGKVVVVLSGYPAGTPSDVGANLEWERARMAAARGAVGMLIVRPDLQPAGWRRLAARGDRPGTAWADETGRPQVGHGLRFVATVGPELAQALFAASPRPLAEAVEGATRAEGRPDGFALGQSVRLERPGASLFRFRSANIVGMIPGSDPEVADEQVLLMAHLDGLGLDEGEGDRIRNGAMDNATGVATLIEVARHMMQRGERPRRTMLFAAVTAEEVGLLGADYLARHPVGGGRVVSVVNLDMPVLTYAFSDVTAFGAEHSTLGPIVARAAARMNVTVSPDPLPQEGLFTRSDHYQFVRTGVPSVFLMTGFAGEGRERFTEFLGNHYHSPGDDLALPFDWNTGARFAQLNYLIAREIADEPAAPRWYADSFFGDAFAGGRARAQRPTSNAQAAAR